MLIFSGSYDDLLDYIIFAALMFYIPDGFRRLRVCAQKAAMRTRPYRAWGYPRWCRLMYVVLCAVNHASLLVVKPVYSWPSFIIVLAGIPVYYLLADRAESAAGL